MPAQAGIQAPRQDRLDGAYWIIRFPPSEGRVAGWMTSSEDAMARRHHQRDTGASHMPSQRQLRVGELIRHALADMLTRGEVHDPVIEGHLITVPEVRMTADLRLATIYVVPLGGRDTEAVLAALERSKRFLRGEIARHVNLKFAPEIRFRVDERFDEAERIEKLLRTPAVKRDLHRKTEDDS
jgi:ribosome-binding factor A